MKIIKKNRIDQRVETGSLDKASGYAMNARPNPAKMDKHNIRRYTKAFYHFSFEYVLSKLSDLPSPLLQ